MATTITSQEEWNGILQCQKDSTLMNEIRTSPEAPIKYGERLLPPLVDAAAQLTPDRVVGMIPKSPDISKGFWKLTIGELAHSVDYMAYWIEERAGKSEDFEAIAYIGLNDFRYWIMELAAIKCGHPILLPSLRNSDSNNIELLNKTKCRAMFFSQPFDFKAAGVRHAGVGTFVIPTIQAMLAAEPKRGYPYCKSWEEAKHDPIAMCHTSGSTRSPKPIRYNHMFLGAIDAGRELPGAGGRPDANISLLDGTTWYLGFPGFHAMGLCFGICSLFFETVAVLGTPETPANGKMIVDIMAQLELGHIIGAPTLLDDMVKNHRQEFTQRSRPLKAVHNAGGPLSPITGEFLSSRFDVIQLYGQTECGKINTLVSERQYWQWFEFNPNYGGSRMEKVNGDEEIYELTIQRIPGQEWCQAIFLTHPHLDLWRTRDLFRKHPTKELYQFEGRKDDIIVLNNGEKFNPVGMEGIIQSHSLVTGVVVAGQSKDQLCLILDSEAQSSEELIDKVWPTVQRANKEAPGHARIYKHMILTTSPDKPLPRAGKGTVQRGVATRLYAEEIEALYQNKKKAKRPAQGAPKLTLPKETVLDFVRQSVRYQLLDKDDFADTDDFYLLGFDSLQTTQLAETLFATFGPHVPASTSTVGITARLIYENPTVEKTADIIHAMLSGRQLENANQVAFKHIQELIQTYTAALPEKAADGVTSRRDVTGLNVAVTGTTGFLGFYLLDVLLEDEAIGRITSLNRSATAAAKFHQQYSAVGQKPPPSTAKLEFIQVSFGKHNFGLQASAYQKLVNEVDIVIHNAWQLDFNRTLSSFEDPHLVGTRTLVEWSLQSPRNMHLFFVSSIATVAYWPGYYYHPDSDSKNATQNGGHEHASSATPENAPDPARIPASPNGYAQSKYVAESVLAHAAAHRQIPVTILRPGQIVDPTHRRRGGGGPRSASTDWFPLLLRSSQTAGLLPECLTRHGLVDFIAVDQLAATIVDIVHLDVDSEERDARAKAKVKVYNLVNPRPVAFTELIPAIRDRLARGHDGDRDGGGEPVQVVPMPQWFDALQSLGAKVGGGDSDSAKDMLEQLPALRLSGFFGGLAKSLAADGDGQGEGERQGVIQTENGCAASEVMRGMKPVTEEDVVGWMEGWGL